jgi:hypothetical protein
VKWFADLWLFWFSGKKNSLARILSWLKFFRRVYNSGEVLQKKSEAALLLLVGLVAGGGCGDKNMCVTKFGA